MKILIGERYTPFRTLFAHVLRERGHELTYYIPINGNTSELKDIVISEGIEGVILDEDTFRKGKSDEFFLKEYVEELVSSPYKGTILVLTTIPNVEQIEKLGIKNGGPIVVQQMEKIWNTNYLHNLLNRVKERT